MTSARHSNGLSKLSKAIEAIQTALGEQLITIVFTTLSDIPNNVLT